MNFKNALILQPLVLTIFFILLRYNDNLDELVIADLFYVLIIFIPIVVGFTFIIKIIIKNNLKSILVSSFFTLLFFIYVPLHDVLYGFQIGSFSIGSHTILFPILFIVSAFLIYKILKSKKNFEKILSISFVTISVLVIFNVSEIVFYSDAYSSNLDEELIQEFLIEKENFRDVYYILLDEHSGTDALQKYLKEKGIDTIIHYPISIPELECFKEEITDYELDISKKNSKRILSLPMYPELENNEIEYVCLKIKDFFN